MSSKEKRPAQPPVGSAEWHEAVAKRSEERGPLLDQVYKELKAKSEPAKGSPEWLSMVEKRGENLADLYGAWLYGKMSQVSKRPTKVTGRARERILDELEATVDAIRAELEFLGPRLRGRNPSRSAARLFLALDRRARELREVLTALQDAENATQH